MNDTTSRNKPRGLVPAVIVWKPNTWGVKHIKDKAAVCVHKALHISINACSSIASRSGFMVIYVLLEQLS